VHIAAVANTVRWRLAGQLVRPVGRLLLVGDSELGEVQVLKMLQKWRWQYVLRQNGHCAAPKRSS
jgi:hypothetical protein